MTRLLLLSTRLPWLVALALFPWPVAAETVGYAHASGQVYRLALDAGSGDVSWQESATGLMGLSGGLALSADGRLFATNYWWPDPGQLAILDPSTGSFELLGPIGTALWTDLAFDDQGRLWKVMGSELYQVDPASAAATAVPIGPVDLEAVGFHAGTLFAIAAEGFDTFWLVEIDPEGGTSQPVVELQGFVQGGCTSESPISMDFDDAGGLWVVVGEWIGTCILPFPQTSYLYYPEPLDGVPGPRRRLAPGGPQFLPGLAVRGGPGVVDIPATSAAGSALLALLVLTAGLWKVARRRSAC